MDNAVAFAIVNFAWASGYAVGGPVGGFLADLRGDALSYLALTVVCLLTIVHSAAPPEICVIRLPATVQLLFRNHPHVMDDRSRTCGAVSRPICGHKEHVASNADMQRSRPLHISISARTNLDRDRHPSVNSETFLVSQR